MCFCGWQGFNTTFKCLRFWSQMFLEKSFSSSSDTFDRIPQEEEEERPHKAKRWTKQNGN